MLIDAKISATKPSARAQIGPASLPTSATPTASSAPTTITEEIALVTDISGVCSAGRHRPDHVVADEDRQHEDREAEDERVDRAGGRRMGGGAGRDRDDVERRALAAWACGDEGRRDVCQEVSARLYLLVRRISNACARSVPHRPLSRIARRSRA